MQQFHSSYNPLKLILDYFPDNHSGPLTLEQLDHFKKYLELGGVVCEHDGEAVDCLLILEELGLLKLIKKYSTNNEIYYEVSKQYGK